MRQRVSILMLALIIILFGTMGLLRISETLSLKRYSPHFQRVTHQMVFKNIDVRVWSVLSSLYQVKPM